MILELIKNTRTHRHFLNEPVKENDILKILNAARFSGAGKNRQNLIYVYTVNDEKCKEIFKNISLGGALKIEEKPTINDRAKAYIAIVTDDTTNEDLATLNFNMGIVSQNIMLMARELGLGGCVIMSFKKKEVDKILELPENFSTKCLICFGKSDTEIEIVDIHSNEDSKYYRKSGVHYVPKIILEDLILNKK